MDLKAVQEDRQGKVPFLFIRDKYKDCDPLRMAELSGTIFDEIKKEFIVEFMSKKYIVTFPEGRIFDKESNNEVEAYTIKTIILRYLVNAKGILATGKDITYKEIPGGHVYYSNFYHRTILKLAKIYGKDLEAFHKAAKNIGGKKVEIGNAAYRFKFLNQVYITFIIWEGDDEVPSSANILFDLNTPYYFDAEDLAVVGEIAIAILKRQGNLPSWKGLYQKQKPSRLSDFST